MALSCHPSAKSTVEGSTSCPQSTSWWHSQHSTAPVPRPAWAPWVRSSPGWAAAHTQCPSCPAAHGWVVSNGCLPCVPRSWDAEQPPPATQRGDEWGPLLPVHGLWVTLHPPSALQPRPQPRQVGKMSMLCLSCPLTLLAVVSHSDLQSCLAPAQLPTRDHTEHSAQDTAQLWSPS